MIQDRQREGGQKKNNAIKSCRHETISPVCRGLDSICCCVQCSAVVCVCMRCCFLYVPNRVLNASVDFARRTTSAGSLLVGFEA